MSQQEKIDWEQNSKALDKSLNLQEHMISKNAVHKWKILKLLGDNMNHKLDSIASLLAEECLAYTKDMTGECNPVNCDEFQDCLTRKILDIIEDVTRPTCPMCKTICSQQELDENRGVCSTCLELGTFAKHGGEPDPV